VGGLEASATTSPAIPWPWQTGCGA